MSEIIIECVPNISEGRNLEIINSIVDFLRRSSPFQKELKSMVIIIFGNCMVTNIYPER